MSFEYKGSSVHPKGPEPPEHDRSISTTSHQNNTYEQLKRLQMSQSSIRRPIDVLDLLEVSQEGFSAQNSGEMSSSRVKDRVSLSHNTAGLRSNASSEGSQKPERLSESGPASNFKPHSKHSDDPFYPPVAPTASAIAGVGSYHIAGKAHNNDYRRGHRDYYQNQNNYQEEVLNSHELKENIHPDLRQKTDAQFHRQKPRKTKQRDNEIYAVTPAQRIEKSGHRSSKNALNHYEIFEQIGRGAHGCVFRARNRSTNQILAMKVMQADNDKLDALMGEIDLLKVLDHPNIVKYHGFVKTPDTLNILLEYCSGGSLRQIYKRIGHGFPENDIIAYVKQILSGLHYLHEQGVVHRDVKAANVLLTESGQVKLADFGVATTVATLHNSMVGTPHWMAPETISGGDGSCTASDIWSLGITIIELFTTHPPYHDINHMAAMHAIETKDNPPLPAALSASGRSFLLECFQKTPSLRKSAAALLEHRWLNSNIPRPNTNGHHNHNHHHHEHPYDSNDSNQPEKFKVSNYPDGDLDAERRYELSKSELLRKFRDNDEGFSSFEIVENAFELKPRSHHVQASEEYKSQDDKELSERFFDLEFDDFNTKESEKEAEMSLLMSKLRVHIAHCNSGRDDTIVTLTGIATRINSIIQKYPRCIYIFQRDHGVSSFIELLTYASDFSQEENLWANVLYILNELFRKFPSQLESFSTLGGIPLVIQFSEPSYPQKVKYEVAKLVNKLSNYELCLKLFLASGGLQIFSRFMSESFESCPDYSLVAVWCISQILKKDLACSKSDLCKRLSESNIIHWLVTLLRQLTMLDNFHRENTLVNEKQVKGAIKRIISVIGCFGLAGANVRIQISNSSDFRILVKLYDALVFPQQVTILNFFRSLSSVSETIRHLASADIFFFYVSLLKKYPVNSENATEVLNIICPSIFNCCRLNRDRQIEFVKLGVVPYWNKLCEVNLPIRQFILPVMFDFVNCNSYVRKILLRYDVATTYFSLLQDGNWRNTALESLFHLGIQEPDFHWLDTEMELNVVVNVFLSNENPNLEAFLDTYYKVMQKYENLVQFMTHNAAVEMIVHKLSTFGKSPAIKVSLLKILIMLMEYNAKWEILEKNTLEYVLSAMNPIKSSAQSSILASSLADRTIDLILRVCR